MLYPLWQLNKSTRVSITARRASTFTIARFRLPDKVDVLSQTAIGQVCIHEHIFAMLQLTSPILDSSRFLFGVNCVQFQMGNYVQSVTHDKAFLYFMLKTPRTQGADTSPRTHIRCVIRQPREWVEHVRSGKDGRDRVLVTEHREKHPRWPSSFDDHWRVFGSRSFKIIARLNRCRFRKIRFRRRFEERRDRTSVRRLRKHQ